MAKKSPPSELSNERTETIDLTRMLPGEITSSGSFDLRKMKASTIGKLLQVIPIPTLLVDRSLHVVFANQASERIIPKRPLVGAGSLDSLVSAPSTATTIVELVQQVFSTRKTLTKEVKWDVEQTELWVRLTLRSVRIGGERFVLILVEDLTSERQRLNDALKNETELAEINERLSQEIGQRIEFEEALRAREEAYRHLVEHATEAIYRTDANGCFTFVNQAVLRILGYTEEEMIGKRYLEVIHPSYQQQAERFYGIQFVKRLPQTSYEFPVLTKCGEIRWLGQNVQLVTEEERVVGFQAVAHDITDRKRAAAAFRREKERFQVLSEHAPFGMVMISKAGKYEYINPKFREMFGYDLTEIPDGNEWFQRAYPDPEYRQTAISAWKEDAQSMGPGERRPRTFSVQCNDGTSKIVNFRTILVRTGEFLLTCEDITDRLDAENRLREREQLLSTVMATSPVAIGLARDRRMEWANDAFVSMFGFSGESDYVGQSYRIVYPSDEECQRVARNLDEDLAIGETGVTDATMKRKDGSLFEARIRIRALDPSDPAKGAVAAITDVTERKRAEEEIRQTEQVLEAVVNATPDVVILSGKDATFRLINSAGADRLGKTPGELVGRSIVEYLPPDAVLRRREHFETVLETGKAVRFEDRHDEFYYDNVFAPIFDAKGDVEAVVAFARDITERKKTEEALKESEARFREFAEAIPQIVYERDSDGKLVFVNRSGLELVGYGPEDLDRGVTLTDCVVPEDKERLTENFEKLLRGERTSGVEYRVIAKDGTRVPVVAYSSPVMREERVVGVRGVCVDVSMLKEAEAVLQRSRDELERLVSERTAELEFSNEQLRQQILEKIRAQEALAESEGRFRGIFETTPDCVFIKDLSFRYALVNSAMCSLLDLAEAEIVGKTDAEIFGEGEAERRRSGETRVVRGEVLEELQTIPVKGALLTFLTIKAPLTGSRGEIVGICGIARNVTERRTLQTLDIPSTVQVRSVAMSAALTAAHLAAASDSTILLTGESGTGKDYLARYIHGLSRRSSLPFYAINCAAIPSELAESELFGHETGAFTGATKKKRGLLEVAEGGTLLLNEIGELPLNLQAKLLAFLDTRTFTRVGGEKSVAVDVRLIAATNRNLREEISAGRFRQDLFYRLDVFSIGVPPLRARLEDLPGLVEELIEKLAAALGFTGRIALEPGVMNTLRRYAWPGNVRELRNVLERALIISHGGPVRLEHIRVAEPKQSEQTVSMSFSADRPLPDVIAELERSWIQEALQRAGGNKTGAAKLLGISRFALSRHMEKWGISSSSLD